MLGIIGVVIYSGHCAHAVKALYEHALGVEIGKPERSLYLGHSALACPSFGSGEQGIYHLIVINKIHPTKTRSLHTPLLVGMRVYYGSYSPHNLPVAVGKEIVGIAELKCRVTVLTQSTHCILKQFGDKIRVIFVQFVIKTHKAP